MNVTSCLRTRRLLGAFVDGELPGSQMLPVSQHLETCADCAARVDSIRLLGDQLRTASERSDGPADDLGGLAGGVVSRVRAERSQSWTAAMGRAVQDWHWLVVGAGSLSAAVVSSLVVCSLVLLGPRPERADSLAALLNNLAQPAGVLFVVVTPVGSDRDSMVMQFDNGTGGVTTDTDHVSGVPSGTPSDRDLVQWLDSSLVGPNGHLVDLRAMTKTQRKRAESLLDEIRRRLGTYDAGRGSGSLVVHRIELVTNTSVTAKGL